MDESALRKFIEDQIEWYHSPQGSAGSGDQSAADHVRRSLSETGLNAVVPRELVEKVLAESLAKHDEN